MPTWPAGGEKRSAQHARTAADVPSASRGQTPREPLAPTRVTGWRQAAWSAVRAFVRGQARCLLQGVSRAVASQDVCCVPELGGKSSESEVRPSKGTTRQVGTAGTFLLRLTLLIASLWARRASPRLSALRAGPRSAPPAHDNLLLVLWVPLTFSRHAPQEGRRAPTQLRVSHTAALRSAVGLLFGSGPAGMRARPGTTTRQSLRTYHPHGDTTYKHMSDGQRAAGCGLGGGGLRRRGVTSAESYT